jgi:hypothetical protein
MDIDAFDQRLRRVTDRLAAVEQKIGTLDENLREDLDADLRRLEEHAEALQHRVGRIAGDRRQTDSAARLANAQNQVGPAGVVRGDPQMRNPAPQLPGPNQFIPGVSAHPDADENGLRPDQYKEGETMNDKTRQGESDQDRQAREQRERDQREQSSNQQGSSANQQNPGSTGGTSQK